MRYNSRLWTTIIGVLLAVPLLIAVSCKADDAPTAWTPQTITVDGDNSDWNGVSGLVLEDQNAAIKLANDSTNLYLLLQLRDARMARMIKMSGITIYLNGKASKDKVFTLKYRGGPSREQLREIGMADTTQRRYPEGGPGMDRPEPEESFTCAIEDRLVEKEIPFDGTQGPEVASGIVDGTIVYEFSIPLSQTKVQDYGLGLEPGNKLGVGVIWGEFDRDAMRERSGGFHGGMGGGMGGGTPPGGMGGGGGRMGGPGYGGPPEGGGHFKRPKKQEVWLKAKLALPTTE